MQSWALMKWIHGMAHSETVPLLIFQDHSQQWDVNSQSPNSKICLATCEQWTAAGKLTLNETLSSFFGMFVVSDLGRLWAPKDCIHEIGQLAGMACLMTLDGLAQSQLASTKDIDMFCASTIHGVLINPCNDTFTQLFQFCGEGIHECVVELDNVLRSIRRLLWHRLQSIHSNVFNDQTATMSQKSFEQWCLAANTWGPSCHQLLQTAHYLQHAVEMTWYVVCHGIKRWLLLPIKPQLDFHHIKQPLQTMRHVKGKQGQVGCLNRLKSLQPSIQRKSTQWITENWILDSWILDFNVDGESQLSDFEKNMLMKTNCRILENPTVTMLMKTNCRILENPTVNIDDESQLSDFGNPTVNFEHIAHCRIRDWIRQFEVSISLNQNIRQRFLKNKAPRSNPSLLHHRATTLRSVQSDPGLDSCALPLLATKKKNHCFPQHSFGNQCPNWPIPPCFGHFELLFFAAFKLSNHLVWCHLRCRS